MFWNLGQKNTTSSLKNNKKIWNMYPPISLTSDNGLVFYLHLQKFNVDFSLTADTVVIPEKRCLQGKINQLHLSRKMMVDFSLSTVVFATPNFY